MFGADRVGEMNILMLWKPGPKNAGQNSCAFQWANQVILTSAFLTTHQNLSILTIPISLSNISKKSTVQQSENSDNWTVWESNNSGNSDSLIIWQSDHSSNSDEPIRHFGQINCLTIQQSGDPRIWPFQQFWLVYSTVSMQILTIPMSLSDISDKSAVWQSEIFDNATVKESNNSD